MSCLVHHFKASEDYLFLHILFLQVLDILIDGRNFCDQLINDLINQYDEVRKVLQGRLSLLSFQDR